MNQSSISAQNKYTILDILSNQGNKSKADLAKIMKLSKPAISDNVNSLIDIGIVIEKGEGESTKTGGRKPMLLELNKTYKYVVCIDLSFEKPVCAIGNLNYELINETEVTVSRNAGDQERFNALEMYIDLLLETSGIKNKDVGCIVISTPGIVTEEGEYFYANPQFAKWTDLNIKSNLEEKYNVPILIKNDVNLAVLAAKKIGAGKEFENMIYISCGLGIGSGLILNNKIYEGKHFAAGEIGYFSRNEDSYGTLEEDINLNAVIRKLKNGLNDSQYTILREILQNKEIEYSHILEAYKGNDEYVREVIRTVGRRIGVIVRNISALLDLEAVILGGIYTDFVDVIMPEIDKMLKTNALFEPTVLISKLGSKGSIYGAFVLGCENIMMQSC